MRGSTQQRTQDRPPLAADPSKRRHRDPLARGWTTTPAASKSMGTDNERWGAAGFEAGWRDADALGSPGDFLEDVEGQLLMFLPPHPELSRLIANVVGHVPRRAPRAPAGIRESASVSAGRSRVPTPVGHNAGIFPKREKEGVRPASHPFTARGAGCLCPQTARPRTATLSTPIIGGRQWSNKSHNSYNASGYATTTYRLGGPPPPPAMSQQRARTPAHQGPIFDADESKFRPQSVPPQNLHQ